MVVQPVGEKHALIRAGLEARDAELLACPSAARALAAAPTPAT